MRNSAEQLAKKSLRTTMLQKRNQLPASAVHIAEKAVAQHFADHPILAFAKSFAAYRAMRSEVRVDGIFTLMHKYNKITALPRMQSPELPLDFHTWQPGDGLVRHTLGVEEPLASAPKIVPEIILTPLLSFDATGARLGYGGGYYDRTMHALRTHKNPPLFIGVAYSLQEVQEVPTEENDARLDGILTEHGVSMF